MTERDIETAFKGKVERRREPIIDKQEGIYVSQEINDLTFANTKFTVSFVMDDKTNQLREVVLTPKGSHFRVLFEIQETKLITKYGPVTYRDKEEVDMQKSESGFTRRGFISAALTGLVSAGIAGITPGRVLGRNRGEKKKDAKQRIFDAAVTLFARKGYNAVGTREIVKKAGVNIAMINYYYGGKAGILKAIINEAYDKHSAAITSADVQQEPEKHIRAVIKNFIKF